MAAQKSTIREMAKLAGVSPACVSMILNKRNLQRFSEETVKKVRQVAASVQYKPKHLRPEGGFVRIICPSVMNPYYSTLIQSIEQEAIERGLRTSICTTYWDKSIEKALLDEAVASRETFGVIFAMIPQQPELARKASKQIPVVAVGDRLDDLGFDTVEINNFHGGEVIGNHLIELGHKRVAYISTALNEEHSARVRRCEGLQAAYHARGMEGAVRIFSAEIPSYIELNTTSIEYDTGYQLTRKCMAEYGEATALVVVNDMVAYGVLDGLADLGLRIPEDVSVCAFDNIFPSRFSGIQLTTVEHSIQDRGRSAFRLISERLKNPDYPAHAGGINRVEHMVQLVARKTTGPAKS